MNDKKTQKTLPLGLKILLFPVTIILVLLVLILIWSTFCFFDRTKAVDAIPPEYAVYLRTDNICDTTEPLLDLNATLIAITSPELQKFREPFLKFKSSKIRSNFFVRHALKRRVDAAVYEPAENGKTGFIAVLDAGFLSGALRMSPLFIPHIKKLADKLELCSNEYGRFYKFKEAGYFVIHKNLFIFTSNREIMHSVMNYNNSSLYEPYAIKAISASLNEPLRVLINSHSIINLLSASTEKSNINYYIEAIQPYLSNEKYASLNFGITNTELNLSIDVPFEIPQDMLSHPVLKLLSKESSIPSLLPKLSDEIQYYTLINAGSLSELKEAALKILPPEKGFEAAWDKGDSVAKILFNQSLEEIIFSWTDNEFAVFGIEGKSEPVLGIKIADETKRREVFDKIFSSFIVQANDSLLVDGVRLPCIQIPSFISGILQALNINVPRPYYLIKNDFIYFSQSPENLVAINSNSKKSKKLSSSENWQRVSSKQSPDSTVSLYYNLERSIPFFIKGHSLSSKILSLYNSGRFDVKIKSEQISIQLQASALEMESSKNIPGFPVTLNNKAEPVLIKSDDKKKSMIFWIEDDDSVNSLNCSTFTQNKISIPELSYIIKNNRELWAVTESGLVYLLDENLETKAGYPVLTGISEPSEPFIYKDSLGLMDEDGNLCFVNTQGEISSYQLETESAIKAAPAVNGDTIAFYEKGFFGGIHVYSNMYNLTSEGPLELDGIAYGSPCIFGIDGRQFIAMITQAGMLYLFDSDLQPVQNFPVELDGVFYLNVTASDNYIYALSSEGELYRVDMNGNYINIRIPYFSAKSGNITIENFDDTGASEIFISGEGNSLYGFNSELELLPSFPIPGYGKPAFVDLNGDNKKDCIIITLDNTISAINVQK